MLRETLCLKTEAEVQVKEEVSDNGEVECENSADLRDLYADHVIKDELVLGPVELHRRCVPCVPGQARLTDTNEPAITNKRQARVRGKKEKESNGNTEKPGPVEELHEPSASSQEVSMIVDIQPVRPAISAFEMALDGKPYKFSQGKTAFARSFVLKTHMRTQTYGKAYKCSHCEAVFAHSCHLKTHLRTHTGERPYKCSQCKAAFVQSGYLKKHLRTHTGEKPYKCGQCKAAFAERGNLKRHLRVHTGEQPFECNICEYKTTTSSNLKVHLLSRHSPSAFGPSATRAKSRMVAVRSYLVTGVLLDGINHCV